MCMCRCTHIFGLAPIYTYIDTDSYTTTDRYTDADIDADICVDI